ncbi:hypothetical protein UBN105_00660 [Helicobacter pylori]
MSALALLLLAPPPIRLVSNSSLLWRVMGYQTTNNNFIRFKRPHSFQTKNKIYKTQNNTHIIPRIMGNKKVVIMAVIQTLSQKLSPLFVKKLITTLMTKIIGNDNNTTNTPLASDIVVFSIPSNKLKEIPLLAQNP